jgi:diguanylate cyclase (GGDEF)-like protein/PAS domain S-box-containing protein
MNQTQRENGLRLLVIEDNIDDVYYLKHMLKRSQDGPYEIEQAATMAEGLQLLDSQSFDLVLLDLSLPDSYGLQSFTTVNDYFPAVPVLILTGHKDESLASQAVRAGAQDYLPKGEIETSVLCRSIRYAIERKHAEEARIESEELFRNLFEQASIGIAQLDLNGQLLRVNGQLCRLLGYSEDELFEAPWSSLFHQDDIIVNWGEMTRMLATDNRPFTTERRLLHRDRSILWGVVNLSLVKDPQDQPKSLIMGVLDITKRKEAEAQLHRRAMFDALTDLPNRVLFTEHLDKAIERHRRHPDYLFAVLFLDLDRFKKVNDSLGHQAGDQALQQVATRLRGTLRKNDTVARLGGDEFVILLDGIKHPDDVTPVLQRIEAEHSKPYQIAGKQVFLGISIGVALSSDGYQTAEEMLQDADAAMYQAKEKGRESHHVIFDRISNQKQGQGKNKIELENDIREGLSRNEFVVYYQPIISLQEQRVSGFEALIRWQHPVRGFISPGMFIPFAEDIGLIVDLDQWVLKEACQQVKQWQQTHPDLTISVNFSTQQFLQPTLTSQIKALLEQIQFGAESLKLEITESAMMKNIDLARTLLAELRGLGISLYMDDFGTGYSSLGYIRQFPVDCLKIDRSFIGTMQPNDANAEIVKAITTLAHNLQMSVVAEGIETAEQAESLTALGCEFGQGFYYARPLPPHEAEAFLHDFNGSHTCTKSSKL